MKIILPRSRAEIESEQARLDALADYDVLDTPAEQSFDRLTRLATHLFDVPMSTITFIDGHRQWFKSQQGMQTCETDREPAFCNVTIQHTQPLVVPDAATDERFSENPFVRGAPHIRFYAGVPLRSPAGQAVGSICAMDSRPRVFNARDTAALSELAGLTIDLLEMQKRLRKAETGGRGALKSEALEAGQLQFMRSAVACTVRARSATSATVSVLDAASIPDRVALVIHTEGISRLCRVSVRSDRNLELMFES